LQNGTCIIAGGDEKLNAETAALAGKLIGCKPFDRTKLHLSVRSGSTPHACFAGRARMHDMATVFRQLSMR
jgi:hypothetical protein